MSDNLLVRQITLGEDSLLELKLLSIPGKRVVEPDARDLADEFAAAANSHGASFVFGVDDKTKEVKGIEPGKLDVAETWLRNICNDSIKPPITPLIRKLYLPNTQGVDTPVIRVDVARSLFVHKSPHGYFYRIGSSKREMPPDLLARLFQQRSQTRLMSFDEQIVADATTSALSKTLFEKFRTPLSSGSDADFLRKLHFTAKDEDGKVKPSVGGVLMACKSPEEYLPSAYIQAVCYRGKARNANEQLDAKDICGPLDVQVAEACRFVNRNMRTLAVKRPNRIDIPQFAMNAVFEAVVNAVAHRDYSISGSKIRLHMFADRLELFSPGALPNSMTIDEIGERQFSRNELICTCLARCPLTERFTDIVRSRIMDRRGEGVPVILSASRKLSGKFPKYELLGDSELKLTIFAAPADDQKALVKIAADLSSGASHSVNGFADMPTLDKIKALIRANPRTTQGEMARACGLSRTSIANWIKKSRGTVRRVGFDNGGFWQVVE